MKPELKREFTAYRAVIEERKKKIETLLNNKKIWGKIEKEEIEKRIHAKAIGELNKKEFRFYGDLYNARTADRLGNGALLTIRENIIRKKDYQYRTWWNLHLLPSDSYINEILPIGFKLFTEKINEIIEKHNEQGDKGYEDKIKVKIPIEYIDDDEIKKTNIKEISLVDETEVYSTYGKFRIRMETDPYCYNYAKLLYNDEFYDCCLSLIKKIEDIPAKAKQQYDKALQKINEVFKNYKKILVVERLKGNDQK